MPFALSGVLFLSVFFSIFAPLPILILFFVSGRGWAWLAAVTNGLLVTYLAGPSTAALYAVLVPCLSLSLAEALRRRWSVERSAVASLITVFAVAVALLSFVAWRQGMGPWAYFQSQVNGALDQLLAQVSTDVRSGWLGDLQPAEWKQSVLVELPSAFGVFALVLLWVNVTLLLRINPRGIRGRLGVDNLYFRRWKAPELLIWPTIAAGFFLLKDFGVATDVARNVFKFLMAVFAIQGLSILSFVFDVWNIRGLFRSLGYLVSIFLMMPLLLSLGFFDQWFDFRGKLRQS